jgi:hypothetical protein
MNPVPIFLRIDPLAVNKKPFQRQTLSVETIGIGRTVELPHAKGCGLDVLGFTLAAKSSNANAGRDLRLIQAAAK